MYMSYVASQVQYQMKKKKSLKRNKKVHIIILVQKFTPQLLKG